MPMFMGIKDFVVVAPKVEEDSTVEFYASGFRFNIAFSISTGCAKVLVSAPSRTKQGSRGDSKVSALEPFVQGASCIVGETRTFHL
jgi:hypothetical protein